MQTSLITPCAHPLDWKSMCTQVAGKWMELTHQPLRQDRRRRARATSHSVTSRFNNTSVPTGAFCEYNICCLKGAACLHSPTAECDEDEACETKKVRKKDYRSSTMQRGMSENETGVWLYDWLKKGLGVFFFFTPTVSNLTVHSLLQFSNSSHSQESLHHPPPPSPCSALRILCIMHICSRTFHTFTKTVFTTWYTIFSGLWKVARTAASNSGYPLWSHRPWGFFYGEGFIIWERLPDIWHTSGSV